MTESLREYELRLLRCTLYPPGECSPQQSASPRDGYYRGISTQVDEIISLIEAGEYLRALRRGSANMFLAEISDASQPPEVVYSELTGHRLVEFVVCGSDDAEKACRMFLVFSVAVAAFLCFTQRNITGPEFDYPACPLQSISLKDRELEDWESWAKLHLMSDGCHIVGKLHNLQYIVFATILVMKTKDFIVEEGSSFSCSGFRSLSWWLARVLFMKQRILDGLSSSLFDLLQVYTRETLRYFGSLEEVTSYWGPLLGDKEAVDIVSLAYLEAGVVDYAYGYIDSCRKHIRAVETVTNFELTVTGMLGYRTIHQTEPKAIKVLVAKGRSSSDMHNSSPSLESHGSLTEIQRDSQQNLARNSEVDEIYMVPKLEIGFDCDSSGQSYENHNLEAIKQALILAQCLLIDKSSREDELRKWDMAPFIEAIDSQKSSFFILRCFCDVLRFRWESSRNRTRIRALETMSHLVEGIRKEFPQVNHRLPLCFAIFFQIVPALQKEYGEHLVRCGLIGEAIRIFEGLDLWDNIIYCNSLLGKKAAAIEVIRRRLIELPNDPSLWCSLGDVTNDDSCYQKALEVSNDKSVRAKRSLARNAYNNGDYQRAQALWESAMMMNSLYPDGWFALGAAALKAQDIDKAVDAFTRAVQLDPTNGEAWNNIACLHMIRKKSKEACLSFKEALKFKRDSWQMWENYSHVAMDAGDFRQALEACQMVLQLSNLKRVDVVLLERSINTIEERTSRKPASANVENSCEVVNVDLDALNDPKLDCSREMDQLFELTGKLLQQVVKNGGPADVWGLFARWQKIKGDLTMCAEALLKQVRSYQGSDLWKDRERFQKFSTALVELSKVYMQIFSETGSCRELLSTELMLKNSIKQARDFSDMEEFKHLEACLVELRMKIQF